MLHKHIQHQHCKIYWGLNFMKQKFQISKADYFQQKKPLWTKITNLQNRFLWSKKNQDAVPIFLVHPIIIYISFVGSKTVFPGKIKAHSERIFFWKGSVQLIIFYFPVYLELCAIEISQNWVSSLYFILINESKRLKLGSCTIAKCTQM